MSLLEWCLWIGLVFMWLVLLVLVLWFRRDFKKLEDYIEDRFNDIEFPI